MNNLYDNFNENVKEFDEQQLLKSINMFADLVEDGITFRKNRNNNIQCVVDHTIAIEFIREHGLAAEYQEYAEKHWKLKEDKNE